jgi:multiple sugar transport system ATP-binding protein
MSTSTEQEGTDRSGRQEQSYVRIENLRKTFNNGDVVAVDNVDINIAPSELVVLVGPSGCGKTTTLRCLSGFETPDSGLISIDAKDVTYEEPKDRDIAFVFQNIALFPHMTVRENIQFGLNMKTDLSGGEKTARVEEVAELLEIGKLIDRKPAALSGGQQQRVSIGRAMVMEPDVFLLDEPFSNLDANLRDQMQTEVKRIQRRLETATIFVTHDQQEAMTLGDKIVVMNHGHVAQIGTPTEIYNNPTNRFVAGFIGSPPTNFIEGTITKTADSVELSTDMFTLSIDARRFDGFSDWGSTVDVGFRPEYIVFNPDDPLFTATLDVIEHQGQQDAVYFSKDGTEFVGVAEQNTTEKTTDEIEVTIDAENVWVFDTDGDRIV